jgi:hypothetical protein
MPKKPLTKDEIKELSNLITQVFSYLNRLKQRNQLASRIQYPKIPPVFSESIIMHLINDRKILEGLTISDVNFGGKKGDILISTNRGEVRVEVKATAKSAFEYFGQKDITADYLTWVHFGDYFAGGNDNLIEINVIRQPSRYFKQPVKITLSKLKQVIGDDLKVIKLNLNEL